MNRSFTMQNTVDNLLDERDRVNEDAMRLHQSIEDQSKLITEREDRYVISMYLKLL
jgi:hypothetical protein